MKNKILIFIAGILVGAILTTVGLSICRAKKTPNPPMMQGMHGEPPQMPRDEKMEKETKAENIDSGEIVTERKIDLSQYKTNITLTQSRNLYVNRRV